MSPYDQMSQANKTGKRESFLQRGIYTSGSPEEIINKFRRVVLTTKVIGVLGVVLLGYLHISRYTRPLSILELLVESAVWWFLIRFFLEINFNWLTAIMTRQMQIGKFIQIMELLKPKYNPRKAGFMNLCFYEGHAYMYLGKDYLFYVQQNLAQVHYPKWSAFRELSLLNLWGNYFLEKHDVAGFRNCLGEWNRIGPRINNRGGVHQHYMNVKLFWDLEIAIQEKRFVDANRILGMCPEMKFPVGRLSQRYNEGLVAEGLMDKTSARIAYMEVAAGSSELWICGDAKRRLAELDKI